MAEPACKRRVAVPPAGEAEPRGTARLARARPSGSHKGEGHHKPHLPHTPSARWAARTVPMLETNEDRLMPQRRSPNSRGADVRVVVDLAVKKEDSSPVPYQKNLTRSIETRGRPQNAGTRAG